MTILVSSFQKNDFKSIRKPGNFGARSSTFRTKVHDWEHSDLSEKVVLSTLSAVSRFRKDESFMMI